ncbi:cytochrome c-type biogenesis protein CcmH [Neobacillus niacini]|uniref:cytochrome c-type biogenesis protein n=1 Tax=Neobacillus niacini TaxID=86668 RepID=UPI0007ABFB96|nr:cytochrome c-type biogenesis protein [Neobacillus niacini]MEC1523027.1 cytochrome c-type biogenesis protein CcmH [Neobacillus niacini]
MKRKIYIGLLLIAFIFQASIIQVQAKEFDYKSKEFEAVASQFMCTCGCGQDHFECDPKTCNLTVGFKEDIVEMMNKGWNKEKIREYYVNIYGEEILTAPEKSGFSLVAWVMPFVVLILAGVAIFFIIRKWVKKKETEVQTPDNESDKDEVEDEILSSMIEEERKKYL